MLKKFKFKDVVIFYDPEVVYEPAEDTFLVLDNVKIHDKNATLLDMGCGCGIIGIYFSKYVNFVEFVDINPYALIYTEINCEINKVKNYRITWSNLFEELGNKKYDICIFNPPYLLENDVQDILDISWSSYKVVKKFLKDVKNYILKTIYIVLNNFSYKKLKEDLQKFNFEIISSKKYFYEEIMLLKLNINRNRPERRN